MQLKPYLAVLLLVTSFGASAQNDAPPEYQVEVIVVRHLDPSTGSEVFPMVIEPEKSDATEDARLPGETFTPVAGGELTLTDMANKIARSRNFRVVNHSAWNQPGFSREDSRRKVFLSTATTGESVTGDFVLSRERYLRLALNLVLQVDGQQYLLDTQRRMISRQVHYFDSPYFGVIAKITPL